MGCFVRGWGAPAPSIFLGIAIFLMLWGVRDVHRVIPPGWRRRRLPRFRGQRRALPRAGFAYLGIMIVLFAGSLLGRSNMLMLVFPIMVGPFIPKGWITYSTLRRTRVERGVVVPRVMAGETVSVALTLHSRKWFMSS